MSHTGQAVAALTQSQDESGVLAPAAWFFSRSAVSVAGNSRPADQAEWPAALSTVSAIQAFRLFPSILAAAVAARCTAGETLRGILPENGLSGVNPAGAPDYIDYVNAGAHTGLVCAILCKLSDISPFAATDRVDVYETDSQPTPFCFIDDMTVFGRRDQRSAKSCWT